MYEESIMASKQPFAGKTIIITGASSGIGRASALAFARAGATTVLASRSVEGLARVAEEIGRINPNVLVVPTDVSVQAQVQDLMDRTVSEFGRIDILFNNAGNAYVGPIEAERFVVDLQKTLAVSFYGTVYGTRSVLPIMKRQGAGHIVNMSSVVGRKSFPRFGAYSIAMHAISAFSDALRQELRGNGIAVTTIHPALTQTGLLKGVDPARYATAVSGDDPTISRAYSKGDRERRLQATFTGRHAVSTAHAAARRCTVPGPGRSDRAPPVEALLHISHRDVSGACLSASSGRPMT
jgi:NAD(P)-dependent dehydrogenase (short-subunit alcohol dehydrogenase family)